MKRTGISRRIDETGRIVIPGEIRKTLGIKAGDPIEIFTHNNEIVLRKYNVPGELSGLIERLGSGFASVRHDLDPETADQIYGHIKALQELVQSICKQSPI